MSKDVSGHIKAIKGQYIMRSITPDLIEQLLNQARTHERKRAFHVLHAADEPFNRMLIAGVKGSYAAPHRHTAKFEVFTYVHGDLMVVEFHDDGTIKHAYDLRECPYVEVPPMTWHAVFFTSDEWAFMEMALWPKAYDPSDKEFAPWAPQEFDPNAMAYVEDTVKEIRKADGLVKIRS